MKTSLKNCLTAVLLLGAGLANQAGAQTDLPPVKQVGITQPCTDNSTSLATTAYVKSCAATTGSSVTMGGDISGPSNSAVVSSVHATGGTLDGVQIGVTSPSSGAFGSLSTSGTVTFNNGLKSFTITPSGLQGLGGFTIYNDAVIGVRTSTAATANANSNSPYMSFEGRYYTGSSSSADDWYVQEVLSSGTVPQSTLNFSHTGSVGIASVNVPALTINNVPACEQDGTNCQKTSLGHSESWFIPASAFVTNTALGQVFYEPVASLLQSVQIRLTGPMSCTSAPTVTVLDLGTSAATTYASATAISNDSTSTSVGVFSFGGATPLSVSVPAGHYLGIGLSGSCTTPPSFSIAALIQPS
jgi:hypothetical protein